MLKNFVAMGSTMQKQALLARPSSTFLLASSQRSVMGAYP